jgi:hypothetical protein
MRDPRAHPFLALRLERPGNVVWVGAMGGVEQRVNGMAVSRSRMLLVSCFGIDRVIAEAEIAKVESLPHFDDLREDMADIVEAFHKAGKSITVEGAYRRALTLNPDLDPQSAAPATISKSQAAAILASRNAAGSVSGAPRTGAKPAATDRRSQIAAAFEQVRNR